VLEHHHCSTTFRYVFFRFESVGCLFRCNVSLDLIVRLLSIPECNILSGLDKAQFKIARDMITSSILATDMTCHFQLIEKFNRMIEEDSEALSSAILTISSPEAPSHPSELISPANRKLIANVLLHAMDLGNSCTPWAIAKRWSDGLLKEFFHQVSLVFASLSRGSRYLTFMAC